MRCDWPPSKVDAVLASFHVFAPSIVLKTPSPVPA